MDGTYKVYPHNPPHLYMDQYYYMITAVNYKKRLLIRHDSAKKILLETIREFCQKYHWQLIDWAILDNHYHLILKSHLGKDLSRVMGGIHRKSAYLIKKATEIVCPRFWWNYWDTCPKNEKQLYAMRNYVVYNPVKHGIVENILDYPWSSFPEQYQHLGKEFFEKRFREYPFSGYEFRDDF